MRVRPILLAIAGLATAGFAPIVWAQIEGGGRGVLPIASTSSYEVSGVAVDVAAKTADEARYGGWKLAQRKAWATLSKRLGGDGSPVGDGTLDELVSGIVVENEQIGPTRYIAKLGVLFNRSRTAALLGVADEAAQSVPMLVIPVEVTGGVSRVFEQRTDWQAAWARFRTGDSAIDYVRPSGGGADPLLLDHGQVGRPGRGWWRHLLNRYGAADVLIPTVRLYRQWPGGPIVGVFEARHGPDDEMVATFSLRVGTADGLNQLLDTGVGRMDALYARALATGQLRRDPALSPPPRPQAIVTDEVGDLIDDSYARVEQGTGQGIAVTLQFDSPGAAAVANVESLVRGLPGVRSATTTSLALGGVSLMRVVVDGDPAELRVALEARGWQITGAGQNLRLRRAPQLLPPDLPADTKTAG